MSFGIDFLGRLEKIRATVPTSIRAVFEAVANAFDATEHLQEKGEVVVRILYEKDPNLYAQTDTPHFLLSGFEIEDNGIGFTDEDMKCFHQSDTTHKKGGKGVGRLLWLKVFDRAEITSVYKQDGTVRKRQFTFSINKGGVDEKDIQGKPVEAPEPLGTTVRLLGPKKERIAVLTESVESLAIQLLEHFLLYFTVMRGQSLTVVDNISDDKVVVGDLYNTVIGDRHKEETFEIRSTTFVLHHLFVKPTKTTKNVIHLCANRRVVTSESVFPLVPEIGRAVAVNIQGFRYHGYVTGTYLNEIADDERNWLKFPQNKEEAEESDDIQPALFDTEGITRKELSDKIAERIREYLNEHISGVRRKKEQQIEEFAAKEQPQYRPFVESAKQLSGQLKSRPSQKEIELLFCEAKIDGREEMTKLLKELVASTPSLEQVGKYRKKLTDKFVTEANRHNLSALAEYVCTRKAVIRVLQANLKKDEDGDNVYEAAVHDLFFPRCHTSDQLPVGAKDSKDIEIENLWLIDERLVFHKLLSSDKALSTLHGFHHGDSAAKDDAPDITIFDPAFVTTEGDDLQSAAIIEFKRPGRKSYSELDNPIKQITDVARKLRSGSIEGVGGELVAIKGGICIFAYVICDITDKVKEYALTIDMEPTPDGVGYRKFHSQYNMIMEIIPYSKLIRDAERRNAAFFKKLGLD